MNRPRSSAAARTAQSTPPRHVAMLLALGMACLLLLASFAPVRAEERIIRAHGISTFGDLKYPEGFAHFDYVNPEAPKGGTFSTWGFGTFDSLTPYI
ncbi:MAG: ABC transporter substrate-binding protein, partial [Paracoccaceae bacterium]|nr:ABC transporter substrate-binding protein [Paracoccaceae bacterium]